MKNNIIRNAVIISLAAALSVCMLIIIIYMTTNSAAAASEKYGEQKKQYNSQIADFNYNGKRMAKIIPKRNTQISKIYYSKNLKSRGKAIVSVKGWNNHVALKGKKLFYLTGEKLMKCNLKGKNRKLITRLEENQSSLGFIISGKRIVYYYGNKLYCCNLSGKHKKLISNKRHDYYDCNTVFSKGNIVYYIDKGGLKVYNMKSGKNRVLRKVSKYYRLLNLEGKHLYYAHVPMKFYGKTAFYSLNVKKNKIAKSTKFRFNEPIHEIIASSGKMFVTTGTGGGNTFSKVKRGKLSYKPYLKKYETARSLGYYRNNIVIENFSLMKGKVLGYLKMAKVK